MKILNILYKIDQTCSVWWQLFYLIMRMAIVGTIEIVMKNEGIEKSWIMTFIFLWYIFYPIFSYFKYINKFYWILSERDILNQSPKSGKRRK